MPDTRKDVLKKQFNDPTSSLTPEEQNALNYHRNNLKSGNFMVQPDGEYTTFYGSIGNVDGRETLIPTYWNGKILPFEEALSMAQKSRIKFPSYKTVDEALKREKFIHSIMENDVAEYRKGKK